MTNARAFAVLFAGDRVDRDAGVIRGVSVVTAGMANGGVMDLVSLQQIKQCCESYQNGLKVVDRHTKGTDSIFSTVGILKNFRVDGAKLVADLHLLRSEAGTPKLMEMAETMPDTFGLSVAFSGVDEVIDGKTHWRCSEIYNAALVDVPAANPTGLFSQATVDVPVHFVDAPASAKPKHTMAESIGSVTIETLAASLKAIEEKCAALEKKFADQKPAEVDMAEVNKKLVEFSANLEAKISEGIKVKTDEVQVIAKGIAKEFSAVVGTSPALKTDGAGTAGDPVKAANQNAGDTKGTAKAFAALAVKKFGETKSKVKAIQLAMAEDPTGYAAFRESGLNINYS